MNILLLALTGVTVILAAILMMTRNMTFFALKYKLLKKKGYLPTILIKNDKEVKLSVQKPDEDNRIRAEEGEKKAKEIVSDKIFWFTAFDSRMVFEREGDTEIFDPIDEKGGTGISAETVDRIAKQAKMQGMLEGEQLMPQIRGIVILIGIGILILLLINWLTMQNTGQIIEFVEPLARSGAQAAEQTMQNVTMN